MDLHKVVMLATQASIIATVFAIGLQATPRDVFSVFRRPGNLVRALLSMFVAMPILAVVLAKAFEFRIEVEIALVALSISPIPPLLPKKDRNAGGDLSYAIGLMVTVALLSIVIVPLALRVLDPLFANALTIGPIVIAKIVLTAAVLPILAGMAVRSALPVLGDRLATPMLLVATVLLIVCALAIIGASAGAIRTLLGGGTVLAMITFVVVGLVVGHLAGGGTPNDRVVLALATACRHPGIAITLGVANYPDQRLVPAAIMIYLIVSAIVCLAYIAWQKKN